MLKIPKLRNNYGVKQGIFAVCFRTTHRLKSAIQYIPTAVYELPYEGAKEMLLVDEVDNKDFLTGLFNAMYDELPMPKAKRKK